MQPTKRHTLQTLFGLSMAAALLATAAAPAAAQTFPNRQVNLMVPYPAGGLSDAIARTVEKPLAKALGQMVIVENLGGVSGALGAQKVLSLPADGHMIYQGSPNETILAPLALQAVKYKSEDFRMVQIIGAFPMAVLARKDLPASNIDELAALAKKAAAEGRPLTYGSVGVGSFYHVLWAEPVWSGNSSVATARARWVCARTWMHCRSRKPRGCSTQVATRASCTPAATTDIRPCCWRQPRCWQSRVTSQGHST
jgi:hypothetical protein